MAYSLTEWPVFVKLTWRLNYRPTYYSMTVNDRVGRWRLPVFVEPYHWPIYMWWYFPWLIFGTPIVFEMLMSAGDHYSQLKIPVLYSNYSTIHYSIQPVFFGDDEIQCSWYYCDWHSTGTMRLTGIHSLLLRAGWFELICWFLLLLVTFLIPSEFRPWWLMRPVTCSIRWPTMRWPFAVLSIPFIENAAFNYSIERIRYSIFGRWPAAEPTT